MKIKITKIYKHDNGRMGISDGDTWYNCWSTDISSKWKEGDTIDYPIEDKEYKGKTSKEIILPKNKKSFTKTTGGDLTEVIKKLDTIIALLNAKQAFDPSTIEDQEELSF